MEVRWPPCPVPNTDKGLGRHLLLAWNLNLNLAPSNHLQSYVRVALCDLYTRVISQERQDPGSVSRRRGGTISHREGCTLGSDLEENEHGVWNA